VVKIDEIEKSNVETTTYAGGKIEGLVTQIIQ